MPGSALHVDLCVIGGGAAGLAVAAGAVQLGFDVALAERGTMGGACLNTGAIPSKALLAAARAAHDARRAKVFGIAAEPAIDFAAVQAHVARVVARIAPHDSQERFEAMGVRVIRASARFLDAHTVLAGDTRITARYFVIATGAAPAVPAIDGLNPAALLTGETIFNLPALPEHLLVVGGDAVSLEMAQAFRRLGSRVTVLERGRILPDDDVDAVSVVRKKLLEEDIRILEQATVTAAAHGPDSIALTVTGYGPVKGTHILAAAGRTPRTNDLGLDLAGVKFDSTGILVDRHLRAGPRHIFALGDVAGGPHAAPHLTLGAGYQAGIVIRNMMFKIPATVTCRALPRVAFTDPEIAQVGLTAAAAQEKYGASVRATIWTYRENDRAQAERKTDGLVKIVTGRGGRIIGASIAGEGAGEMIGLWTLAITHNMKMKDVAGMIAAYPTYTELGKRAAGAYFSPALFSARTRTLVGLLDRLPF